MQLNYERRNIEVAEIRVVGGENEKKKIKGYAAVFNKLSEDLGGFREKIDPGTFKTSISRDDIRALFNHDANHILGRNKANTLRLEEDDKGLLIEIDPPDTQFARDLMELINRGDISQMSFGFIAIIDVWEYDKQKPDKDVVRTLQEAKLFDISPVTYPAYPQTSVKVRDYLQAITRTDKLTLERPDERGALIVPDASLELYKTKIKIAKFGG